MGASIVPQRRPRRSAVRPRDVYRSDFLGSLHGTPLDWCVAWEVIEAREYVEALARLAVLVAVASGLPVASVVAVLAAVGEV